MRVVHWCLLSALLLGMLALPAVAEEDPPGTYAGKDVHWWLTQLKDRDGANAAIVAFKKIGRPALEPLVDAIGDPNPRVRQGALRGLAGLGVDFSPVVEQLAAALDTTDRQVQRKVVGLLQRCGPAALPHLTSITKLLYSSDRSVVSAVLKVLSSLGPEARSALDEVLKVGRDGDRGTKEQALRTAMRLAPRNAGVVSLLGTALAGADDRHRASLLENAKQLDAEAPGLGELLAKYARDPYAQVRQQVAHRLADVVFADPSRLDALKGLLEDDSTSVRMAAATSLARLGTRAAPAVGALIRLLEDPDYADDPAAIRALSVIGEAARPSYPTVLVAMARPSWKGSRGYRDATQFFGHHPDALVMALSSHSPDLRRTAFYHLSRWSVDRWRVHLPRLGTPIRSALLGADAQVRPAKAALDALGALAVEEREALELLLAMAHAQSEALRKHAALRVGHAPGTTQLLLELFMSEDPSERRFAMEALRGPMARDAATRDAMWTHLASDREALRAAAGRMLILHMGYLDPQQHSEESVKRLAEVAAALLDEPEARTAAISRLGQLGLHALPHVDSLFALLAVDGMEPDAWHAAVALRTIAAKDEVARAAIQPRLEATLIGDDHEAAAAAAHGLLGSGRDELLVEILPTLMRDPRKAVHFRAVDAAGQLGQAGKPLVPVLLEIASSPPAGSHVHINALQALTALAPENEDLITLAIERLIDPRRKDERASYEQALGTSGGHAAPQLAQALEAADAESRLVILRVLGNLGRRATAVRDRLARYTEDKDAGVAAAARKALERIPSE